MRGPASDQVIKAGGVDRGGAVTDQVLGRASQSMGEQEAGFQTGVVDAGGGEAVGAGEQCFGDRVGGASRWIRWPGQGYSSVP
jgi:hypothetical protein